MSSNTTKTLLETQNECSDMTINPITLKIETKFLFLLFVGLYLRHWAQVRWDTQVYVLWTYGKGLVLHAKTWTLAWGINVRNAKSIAFDIIRRNLTRCLSRVSRHIFIINVRIGPKNERESTRGRSNPPHYELKLNLANFNIYN